MKRNLIILIIIAVVSLVAGSLIYYSAGLGKSEDIKVTGKINVLVNDGNYDAVNQAAASFKEIHPRVDIEVAQISDVYAGVTEELEAGGLEEDVFVVQEKDAPSLLNEAKGNFMDLTQYVSGMDESFPKGLLAGVTSGKSIYGIPMSAEPMIIVYRRDVFSVEGVDASEIKTWDDFRAAGIGISESTGKRFLVYDTDQFERLRSTLLSQLRINYSDVKNYTRVSDLINGMVADKTMQATSSSVSALKQGKALAAIVSPSDAVEMMEEATSLQGKWGAMKLPAFEPGGNRDVTLGGCSLLINEKTRNSDLAKEFSKYLSSDIESAAYRLKEYGSFSAAYTVYGDSGFGFSAEYYGMDIWSLFADVAEDSPQNVYK
ncbi:MAG TPA: extracellular solute-binding protein [Clostridiaceae bacterium]|nr:extracellular solute-binding protein [Clostridiaceae bacterium]